jgi:cytoskeletal protein CcmA (bactofilin family)
LSDCRTIEVLDTGTFKGSAEIESAEISGQLEGNLTVRQRLLIRSTGRVIGTVRYGRIEIEQGGEINGDVRSLGTTAKGMAEALSGLAGLEPRMEPPRENAMQHPQHTHATDA